MENPKKGLLDHLAPGATVVGGLLVLVGLAGVATSLTGAYQTWLSPTPWVLLIVAALLLFLTGIVLGRSANWRGAEPLTLACMLIVGCGLLGSTIFLALWKGKQETLHSIGQNIVELRAILDHQAKTGQSLNAQQVQKVAFLTKQLDDHQKQSSLLISKEDVEKAINDAIDKGKPKTETPTVPPVIAIPVAPVTPISEGEEQVQPPAGNPNPQPMNQPETQPVPPGPGSSPGSDNGRDAFVAALTGLLTGAGLPLSLILAILSILGQLFSMGVQVEDLGPIVQAVKTIHTNGGQVNSGDLEKLLAKAKNPKLAADALQLIGQQQQLRERMTPEAQRALDQALRAVVATPPTPSPDNGKGESYRPKTPAKGKAVG